MPGYDVTIGVLGGGQLGRMLCEAAGPLGIPVIVLDAENAPAKQANSHPDHITGSFKDPAKIRELAKKSDFLTVEIEHVNADILEEIQSTGVEVPSADGKGTVMKKVPVHPAPKTLKLIQDKYAQKEHLKNNDIPITAQTAIESGDKMAQSLAEAGSMLGFPFMLKARNGSYDGRGNYVIKSADEIPGAVKEMGHLNLYAEKWVPFKMELSVMVIRFEDDEGGTMGLNAYPCVETIHEDSICTKVYMPPRGVNDMVTQKAQEIATKVVGTLWGRGVFAVEMFWLDDDSILVNEIAPRPHNSGHVFIEAVPYMSQYKAQLYAILGLMPPNLVLQPRVESAIMLNILGGKEPKSHDGLIDLAESTFSPDMDVYVHLYGKESKPSRKIGHITLTGPKIGVEQLDRMAAGFVAMVDQVAKERRKAATAALRPTTAPAASKLASTQPLVAVTMGSDSDLKVLAAGLEILDQFGVPYEENITSADGRADRMANFAKEAAGRGIKVIIAGAGAAAHLPGMVASHTPLPVIGVPVKATHLDGQDSLFSIVQMPRGVPCATVGINNSTNAALLAVRILGSIYPEYMEKMVAYQLDMETTVEAKAERLQSMGYKAYLEGMKK